MKNADERKEITLCSKGCCGNCPKVLKEGDEYTITDDYGGRVVLQEQQLIDLVNVVKGTGSTTYQEDWPPLGWNDTHHIIATWDGGKVSLTRKELLVLVDLCEWMMNSETWEAVIGEE